MMNARAKKVLGEALQLPITERADLVHELLTTLDGDVDADAEDAWGEEIDRRVQRVLAGEGVSYPVDEALAHIRANLR
ncbi:MAG: addiction module protein [Polyangiaceae bacterium]|nr:addiction module protein [Polyangiaceae bacterium]